MNLYPDVNKVPPPNYAEAVGGVYATNPMGFYTPNGPNAPKRSDFDEPQIVTALVPLGPFPIRMTCPVCKKFITTATESKPGVIAYISGALIALFGCWLGCCLIPCCVKECLDVYHTCPECTSYLGRFKRV